MELKLSLPEELARTLGLAGSDGPEQARFMLLLEFYREGRISFGRLAELSNLSQEDLLDRMAEHGTYLNYSLGDLQEDRQALP